MKSIFISVLAASILTLTSCGSGGSSILGGSWSYKGINYSAVTAIGSTTAHTLTATTGSTSEVDDLVFHFSSYPPVPGTYKIINTFSPAPTSSQVYVVMNLGTKGFTVDATNSYDAVVSVSGTKVSVTIGSVTFSNVTGQAIDSGPFTAAISQNL